MLATLIIVFREVIEAGLIVGIVMAVTKTVPSRGLWIAGGVGGGMLGAAILAIFAGTVSSALSGMGQEVFNATILGVAVIMLAWHNAWMARHGREMAANLKAVGRAVASGSRSLLALAIVIGVAVLREGSEVVLFLYGIVISDSGSSGAGLFLGGVLGLLLGVAVTAVTYLGLVTIPAKYLFGVTSFLITFLAAGMAAQAVSFLEQAGIVTILDATVWDSSGLLQDSSLLGKVLHTLVGYNDHPSLMQVVVYVAVFAAIMTLTRILSPAAPPKSRAGERAGAAST